MSLNPRVLCSIHKHTRFIQKCKRFAGSLFCCEQTERRARAGAGESGSRVVNDYLARANGVVESRQAFIAEVAAHRPQVDIY